MLLIPFLVAFPCDWENISCKQLFPTLNQFLLWWDPGTPGLLGTVHGWPRGGSCGFHSCGVSGRGSPSLAQHSLLTPLRGSSLFLTSISVGPQHILSPHLHHYCFVPLLPNLITTPFSWAKEKNKSQLQPSRQHDGPTYFGNCWPQKMGPEYIGKPVYAGKKEEQYWHAS